MIDKYDYTNYKFNKIHSLDYQKEYIENLTFTYKDLLEHEFANFWCNFMIGTGIFEDVPVYHPSEPTSIEFEDIYVKLKYDNFSYLLPTIIYFDESCEQIYMELMDNIKPSDFTNLSKADIYVF